MMILSNMCFERTKREKQKKAELMKLAGCLGQILQAKDIYKMLCGYAVVDP